MAEVELNDVIDNMEKLFSQQITELDKQIFLLFDSG